MDEEDVVFEGSPLAKHLGECGIEFEVEKREIKQNHTEQDSLGKKWKLFDILQEKSTLIDDYYRKSCIQLILNSNLLEYEDFIIVEEFMKNSKYNDLNTKISLALKKGVFETFIFIIVMVSLKLLSSMVNTALCLLLPLILAWRWQSIITAPVQARKMKKFFEAVTKVESLVKKALLLISEYSLISRGYLMVEKCNLVWQLGKSDILDLSRRSQSNLPGLRIAVLNVSRRLTIALSDATSELRHKRPLPLSLDHPGLYYPEFDDRIRYELEMKQGERLPSLENLLSAVNLHHLKRSEYLRRLFLDFLLNDSSALNVTVNKKLENELFNSLKVINEALIIYNPYVSTLKKQKKLTYDKSHLCLGDLSTCCYSTSIHIQEALCSSREIEGIIENCDQPMSLETDKLDGICEKINHHLKCAGLCVERAMILLSKKGSNSETTATFRTSSPNTPTDSFPMAAKEATQMKEYIPQDEVFEMYNVGEENIGRMGEEYEEETEERLDKENKTLIMKELRNVLLVKAADWRERERKAKMRQCESSYMDISDSKHEAENESIDKNVFNTSDTTTEKIKVEAVEEKKDDTGSIMPSQSEDSSLDSGTLRAAVTTKPIINEPFVGSTSLMMGNLAAEAVAKAIAQRPSGLLSEVYSFDCSGSEGSQGD